MPSLLLSLCLAVLAVSTATGIGASSARAADACPANEALRAENNSLALGGCRAFERVTPSFQNGFGAAEILGLAPGGEGLIATSTSGFAGAESSRLGPYYKMTRTSSGWQTASISPPATQFPGNRFASASADLSRSIWELRSPAESIYAQNLYRREPDGTFVKIGPMVPPSSESGPPANGAQFFLGAYQVRGASADLSHVYFSIINGLGQSVVWPGDTTTLFGNAPRAFSLYEYDGVGNTRPALVGVNTQGRLISDCATFLGSDESHEMYNAVSADGGKAFFTADGHDQEACPETVTNNGKTETVSAPEVTEVYARLGGQETVAISEPTPQDCMECRTGVRKGAQFEGASADGSKVFFTTTQELLPGAETNNLYEYDFDAARGRRVRQLSGGSSAAEVLGVARISEDGSHAYFVARGILTTGINAQGNAPAVGQPNLYVYARDAENPVGGVSFVATLTEATEASPNDSGDWAATDSRPVQATPNGQWLVFDSVAPLTADVSGEGPQVFEYDAQTEELIRVSRGQNGYPQGTANANNSFSFVAGQKYNEFLEPSAPNTLLALSDDGSQIQFSSPAALTPANEEAAAANATSVYEYRSAGPIGNGDVFTLSAGLTKARVAGISSDGTNAFFRSEDLLVAGQTDSQRNIYDAREDGGFPGPVTPAACLGEGCLQGAPQPPLEPSPPGSLTATEGNVPPPPAKKKNKKHHTKKHHHKKGQKKPARANSNRRAGK